MHGTYIQSAHLVISISNANVCVCVCVCVCVRVEERWREGKDVNCEK